MSPRGNENPEPLAGGIGVPDVITGKDDDLQEIQRPLAPINLRGGVNSAVQGGKRPTDGTLSVAYARRAPGMMESVHAFALRHAALGLAVLPVHRPVDRGGRLYCSCGRANCSSPAKHPVGRLAPRGLLDASRDPATLGTWFEGKAWNIGIATGAASGIVVLDIDPRHGGDEALAALEAQHGPLPLTWRFLTGGGGEHVLFRHPGGVVKNSAGKVGPGIDVRGDGGYIVAPPSIHISGRPYAISVDHHPEDAPLATLPDWLLAMIVAPPPRVAIGGPLKNGRTPTNWRGQLGNPVAEGERNITVARLAGILLSRRIDPHVCLDLMLAFNAARCSPPLPDDEVVATVASIARREFASRRERRLEERTDG
ncbi:MAG: bifunctional DNA primase/polymerase [Alphaproteobacteria bacterium]